MLKHTRRHTLYVAVLAALVAAVVLLGVGATTARADFALTGTQHLDVTTNHGNGTLHDFSTADILAGGYVGQANVYDNALLRVDRPSGSAVGTAEVNGAGQIAVFSGSVGQLTAINTSTVTISGGSVSQMTTHQTSFVDISGGSVYGLNVMHQSCVLISGGSVYNWLYVSGNGRMIIRGGSVSPILYVNDYSSVVISGGSVSGLSTSYTSSITLYGYDFQTTGGLSLVGDKVLGTGMLTGKWYDGTPWATTISGNASGIQVVVPEPATLSLLVLGLVGLVKSRRRLR